MISIVIPHYGSAALLQACLASIGAFTTIPVEVIVVDNGTGQAIDADVVVRNPENLGFAVACNQGVAAASGDQVLLLNNDCEVRENWLEPLAAALEADVGAVGCLLLYPNGNVQHAGVRIFRDKRGLLTAENIHEIGTRRDVDAVTGACMLVDKKKFFEAGAFDEGFINGYEDVSLCLSLRRAGHRVVFEPASRVLHHESQSGPARWSHVRQNVARLQEQWAETVVG